MSHSWPSDHCCEVFSFVCFDRFAKFRNMFNYDTRLTPGNPITKSHTLPHALSVMHVLSLLPVGLIVHT